MKAFKKLLASPLLAIFAVAVLIFVALRARSIMTVTRSDRDPVTGEFVSIQIPGTSFFRAVWTEIKNLFNPSRF